MPVPPGVLIRKDILPFLPANIKTLFQNLDEQHYSGLEEIRLRCGKPLSLRIGEGDFALDTRGRLDPHLACGYTVSTEDIQRAVASISDNSLYAFEEEIGRGFITIPGGHRVGLAGQTILDGNHPRTMKHFSGV
ncbi:MAG: stage III sporulation protein AA, partial [Syntrophomonadaceae bacterium]